MRITRITGGLKLGYIFIEVIVVTIGILIALQIDNWKESRNRKEQELKTLRELKTALQEDLRILALMQARYDEGISSSDVILRHLHKGGRYHDSLQTHMQKVAYGFQFQQRTSAYENLKAAGIDLISNDDIKLHLVSLYDFAYPRQLRLIDMEINGEKRITQYLEHVIEYKVFEDAGGKINVHWLISPSAFQDRRLLNYVSERYVQFGRVKTRFEDLRNQVARLIESIDTEINQL